MLEGVPFSLLQVFVFIVGCCLGSFYNVVIHRLPADQSLVRPGSHCPKCGHDIAFYDNVPILSFMALRGKCRYCQASISVRYPVVEALTGLLALFLFRAHGLHPQFLIEFLLVSLLVITFIDFDTYLIPDVLSLPGILAGFALSFFTPRINWLDSLLGIFIGGGFFYLIAIGYQFIRKQEGLGGGDIKLLAMIGAFVGLPGVVFTVLLSSLVGTMAGVFTMWRTR
jgi:leader peptidase (prepilin peptidase)/N-methyltransferase